VGGNTSWTLLTGPSKIVLVCNKSGSPPVVHPKEYSCEVIDPKATDGIVIANTGKEEGVPFITK
jgi:hypothetical protein